MHQYRWLVRRRHVALIALVSVLLFSAVLTSGCGLFGGDDEQPDVVAPPQTSSEASQDEVPTATATTGASEQAAQQDEEPTQATAVTTSPAQDESQQEQTEAEAAPEPDDTIYIVQEGDTLAGIANRLGVRIDDLITLNGIQNPDRISTGQELRIPGAEPSSSAPDRSEDEQDQQDQQDEETDEDQIEPPSVELPTVAVPAATPTRVTYTQFPQPGPDETTDSVPNAPSNFLQYGAAALPWLHGIAEIEPIIELFIAWPMPALAVGHDRIYLVDTNGDGNFAASIVFTDPNSFGAAVPYSNLVVYDPVPGNLSKYRIAYDHALTYAREVQGIQQIIDVDLTGDAIRDLTFREITCDASGCVSSFYVLASTGDGYRTVTGPAAQVGQVTAIQISDSTGDGVPDIIVEGLAMDESTPSRYRFVFSAQGDNLVEVLRVSEGGGSADSTPATEDDDSDNDDLDE